MTYSDFLFAVNITLDKFTVICKLHINLKFNPSIFKLFINRKQQCFHLIRISEVEGSAGVSETENYKQIFV